MPSWEGQCDLLCYTVEALGTSSLHLSAYSGPLLWLHPRLPSYSLCSSATSATLHFLNSVGLSLCLAYLYATSLLRGMPVHTCLPCSCPWAPQDRTVVCCLYSHAVQCSFQQMPDTQQGVVSGWTWTWRTGRTQKPGESWDFRQGSSIDKTPEKDLTRGPEKSAHLKLEVSPWGAKGNEIEGETAMQVSLGLAEIRDCLIMSYQRTPRPYRGAPGAL